MEDCVIVPLPVRASHRHVSLPLDFVGRPAEARRCQWRMLFTIVSEKLATYSDAFLLGRAPLQSECVNLWLCRDQRSKRMCCNKRRRCTWVDHRVPAWRSTVWISTVQFYCHPHTSPDPPHTPLSHLPNFSSSYCLFNSMQAMYLPLSLNWMWYSFLENDRKLDILKKKVKKNHVADKSELLVSFDTLYVMYYLTVIVQWKPCPSVAELAQFVSICLFMMFFVIYSYISIF